MSFSIIGSGAIGSALARRFADKGMAVQIANSRGPASIATLAGALGENVVPVPLSDALAADVVILAIPFTAVADTVRTMENWNGRIVVDATNAINFTNFTPLDLGGRVSTEVVAETLPGAKVVKAFNTLPATVLASPPEADGGRRILFVSNNDPAASKTVEELVNRLGFAPVALGKLSEGGRLQQFGGSLVGHSLLKQN